MGTLELAIRPDRFVAAGLRFDPRFDAGGPVPVRDESIFLADALRAGLRGVHSDPVLGVHPEDSSGLDRGPQADAWRRAVFRRALGPVVGPLTWGEWRAQDVLRQQPTGGAVFTFRGHKGDRLKLLYWDGQGFCLYYKEPQRGHFPWPNTASRAALPGPGRPRSWRGVS